MDDMKLFLPLVLAAAVLGARPFPPPPQAWVDQVVVPESWSDPANQTPLVVNVLANDVSTNGLPLTVTAVGQACYGTVTFTASTVTYTPRPELARTLGRERADHFAYTVGDGQGGTDTAYVCLANTPRPLVREPFRLGRFFETARVLVDPINNFFDETLIVFDDQRQRQIVHITFNNPNETPLGISIFLFPTLYSPTNGALFRLAHLPDGTPNCFAGAYNLPLNPLRFPARTTGYLGREIVAGQPVTRWLVETELTLDIYTLATVGPNAWPLAIESRPKSSPNQLSTWVQYHNYVSYAASLPAEKFALPPNCLGN
jgi:hypothetical protein